MVDRPPATDPPVPDPPPTETDPTPEAQVRARALRLLARRERTRRGLERSLLRAGHARCEVGRVLDELERQGLLSDLRYCRLYLSEQSHLRPRSLRLLRRDLRRAGASRETIERALAEAGPELSDEALALAAARKKLRTAGGDPARLSRLLQARGFSAGLARRVRRELVGDEPASGPDPTTDGTEDA